MVLGDEREYDRRCKKWFKNNDAYHNHKIFSSSHITCVICSEDFSSDSARARHQTQLHGASQTLNCSNCDESFTRLGALMSHISTNACFYKTVQEALADKEKLKKAQEALEKLTLDPISISEPPLPVVKRSTKEPTVVTEDVDWMDENLALEFQDPPPPPAIPWGDEKFDVPVTKNMNKDFPKLGRVEYRDGNTKVEDLLTGGPDSLDSKEKNKWARAEKAGKGKELFPEAPPNPQQEITNAVIEEAKAQKDKADEDHPYHPNNPHCQNLLYKRDGSPWQNTVTGRWNCPHADCKRQFNGVHLLETHLKSEAHFGVKLRCPRCHNLFTGVVALTQHVESQATSCYMRESSNANKAVHTITNGIARVVGRHDDGTVKYAVYETFTRPGPGAIKEIEVRYKVGGTLDKKAAEDEKKIEEMQNANVEW